MGLLAVLLELLKFFERPDDGHFGQTPTETFSCSGNQDYSHGCLMIDLDCALDIASMTISNDIGAGLVEGSLSDIAAHLEFIMILMLITKFLIPQEATPFRLQVTPYHLQLPGCNQCHVVVVVVVDIDGCCCCFCCCLDPWCDALDPMAEKTNRWLS